MRFKGDRKNKRFQKERKWPSFCSKTCSIRFKRGARKKFLAYSTAQRAPLALALGLRYPGLPDSNQKDAAIPREVAFLSIYFSARLTAIASNESERSRLRRIPCSTCTSARAAPSIQSRLMPCAICA